MQEENKIKFGTKELIILILIVSCVFFYLNYSFTGLRLFAGSLLLFFVPFYVFLDSFDITTGEKLIFSFFIGIGMVPLFVYYLSRFLVSLRISILVCFVILVLGSFLFRKFYKHKKRGQSFSSEVQ